MPTTYADHFVGRRLVGGIADHDAIAARGSRKRGGAADAAAAAGDDNYTIVHLPAPRSGALNAQT
jgi:hypothetical protein